MKRKGTGELFQNKAKTRFMELTGSRYDSLCRRLEKKGLQIAFSKDQFREHLLKAINNQYDGFIQCRYCRGYFGIVDIAADHEIPLSRGGSLLLDNIGFPCHDCNNQKGSLDPTEFLKLLDFLHKEIPMGRKDVLSRLSKAVALAQGARSNAAMIGELKKSGQWQAVQAQRRAAKKAKEAF